MPNHHDFTGALTCARYAFAPNFYCYCGPDTNGEFGDYLKAEISDGGLVEHLTQFETLYPYLEAIAHANGLADPLDSRVVEAYWLGNPMLEKIKENQLFTSLIDGQKLKNVSPKKNLPHFYPKSINAPESITAFMSLMFLLALVTTPSNTPLTPWISALFHGVKS